MRINYDFGDLETFVAVMETGSFHQAAERTNLSQPAVTRRIRKLEEELGSQLFERTTRRVTPTLAGKRLLARAQSLLADAEEAVLAMRDDSLRFAYQRHAVVTVAAVPTIIASLLAPALSEFRTAGHTARVRVLDMAANEVAEAVGEGEADFGLCAMPVQAQASSFVPLFDEPLDAFVHRGHALARHDGLNWAALAGETLILPSKGTGNRLLIDDALASARVPPHWSYEAFRSSTALDLARAGLGAAILPRSALKHAAAAEMHAIPVSDPHIVRPIGLLSPNAAAPSGAAGALKDHVMARAADLNASALRD